VWRMPSRSRTQLRAGQLALFDGRLHHIGQVTPRQVEGQLYFAARKPFVREHIGDLELFIVELSPARGANQG